MPDKVTVTGTTGPAITSTAQVFNNLNQLNFDFAGKTVTIFATGQGPVVYDLYATDTVTVTISAGPTYTAVINQV